jgi:hypothetical protein
MPRPNTSGISALFKRTSEKPKFTPEVLQALDDSNGYETYQDDDGNVCLRIVTLDGENEVLVPNEQLEALLHIVRVAISANSPKRTRRSKEEIAAANGNGERNGVPDGQEPVSNNVMVNLMDIDNLEAEEGTDDKENKEDTNSEEKEPVASGTRSRRR